MTSKNFWLMMFPQAFKGFEIGFGSCSVFATVNNVLMILFLFAIILFYFVGISKAVITKSSGWVGVINKNQPTHIVMGTY